MGPDSLVPLVLTNLGIACAGVGLFCGVWVLVTRVDGTRADRLLAALLGFASANTLHPLMGFRSAAGPFLLEPLQVFLPLGLLWYLRSLLGRPAARPSDVAVLVIPLVLLVVANLPWHPFEPRTLSLLLWGTEALLALALLVPVAAGLHRYRTELQGLYSNLEGVDPGWLQGLLVAAGGLFVIDAVLTVLIVHVPVGFPLNPLLGFLMGLFTLFLSWTSLRRKPRLAPVTPEVAPKPLPEEWSQWAPLIRQRLEGQRLYLDPDLTLDDLARASGLTRHETSAALNRGLQTSFFDLVNGLRVAEFQRLCADPGKAGDKILTLAFEAGFNSKPTFNLVFKKLTGRTPSEYRRSAPIGS